MELDAKKSKEKDYDIEDQRSASKTIESTKTTEKELSESASTILDAVEPKDNIENGEYATEETDNKDTKGETNPQASEGPEIPKRKKKKKKKKKTGKSLICSIM
eukprot:m.34762 g.34762  ORF g.34762 m.34762 type:complete len:104 (-) comp8773_c0_seq2:378-689(-)